MPSMMKEYSAKKRVEALPRLPLRGELDVTYRCNNNCRHCWVRVSSTADEIARELTLDEIRKIVDEARRLGTREWAVSGGEPMLRPDFEEILDYLTRKATTYSLNTNGTLITPRIARLLKRRGTKMVALYGATAAVHDQITRTPGSFEAALRGIAYLREAAASFIVQLIPMRDNYHQWQAMNDLARSLSPDYRCGASWLYFSHPCSPERNAEIDAQRLLPAEVIALDEPDVSYQERLGELQSRIGSGSICPSHPDDRLFAGCIGERREFHIDPYGGMSFCCFIKDPAMRYDMHSGSLQEAWDKFIPSLTDRVRGGDEWERNCGACDNRPHCRWCAAYAYLETGRFSAPVPYLCRVAEESSRHKQEWAIRHRRYFDIAGITIRIESDLPLDEIPFAERLQPFEVQTPGKDLVTLRHVFGLPQLKSQDLGTLLYRKPPWAIYRKGDSYIYVGVSSLSKWTRPHRAAVFDADFAHGIIYTPENQRQAIHRLGFSSLTLFSSDQILVAQLLANRNGCYLHAAGVIMHGQGLLFVGHSDAGKSTVTRMLKGQSEILCDDRIIVRRWEEGFKIHGTWSHGDVPDVSPNSAPLKAIFFLQKAEENRLVALHERKAVLQRLLACLVRPLGTREWWERSLELMEQISLDVPCYDLYFERSGTIASVLKDLVDNDVR